MSRMSVFASEGGSSDDERGSSRGVGRPRTRTDQLVECFGCRYRREFYRTMHKKPFCRTCWLAETRCHTNVGKHDGAAAAWTERVTRDPDAWRHDLEIAASDDRGESKRMMANFIQEPRVNGWFLYCVVFIFSIPPSHPPHHPPTATIHPPHLCCFLTFVDVEVSRFRKLILLRTKKN